MALLIMRGVVRNSMLRRSGFIRKRVNGVAAHTLPPKQARVAKKSRQPPRKFIGICGANTKETSMGYLGHRVAEADHAVTINSIPFFDYDLKSSREHFLLGSGFDNVRLALKWRSMLFPAVRQQAIDYFNQDPDSLLYIAGFSLGGALEFGAYLNLPPEIQRRTRLIPCAAALAATKLNEPFIGWIKGAILYWNAFKGGYMAPKPRPEDLPGGVDYQGHRAWAGESAVVIAGLMARYDVEKIHRAAYKPKTLLLHAGKSDKTVHYSSATMIKKAIGPENVQEAVFDSGHWFIAGRDREKTAKYVLDFIDEDEVDTPEQPT